MDFNFECIKLLENDFCKQRYTSNVIIPGQDRIYPKIHLCRTFFAEYTLLYTVCCPLILYIMMQQIEDI